MRVSEPSDAEAVRRVQLAEQELAACIPHPVELQQTGCWEQGLGGGQIQDEMGHTCTLILFTATLYRQNFYLNITLPDHNLCGVGVLDQLL